MAKKTVKATEKEKVLPVAMMSMKSFMGKQDKNKKPGKPGLFEKFKGKKK